MYTEYPDIVYTVPCAWNVQIGAESNTPQQCIGSETASPNVGRYPFLGYLVLDVIISPYVKLDVNLYYVLVAFFVLKF